MSRRATSHSHRGDLARKAGQRDETALRRPYAPPRLQPLGDVRSLVLGASPGIGDSATDPFTFRP